MAFSYSDTLANDVVGVIQAQFPAGAILEMYSGAAPALTAAPTGTLLVSITLPTGPWTVASRACSLAGTWSASAVATGTLGYFRLKDAAATDPNAADNTHRRVQGSITATGGGGDLTVDNVSVASGQTVTVTAFSVSM